MSTCCNPIVIKLRQGDDSDFNNNHIIFHITGRDNFDGWYGKFRLQGEHWNSLEIKDGQIELVISGKQTDNMESGTCYGWLQLVDEQGKAGTVYSQRFEILKREVW